MADTNSMNVDELLPQVNTAISKILLGGQSYQIGSRKLTRADLKELYAIRRDLEAQAAAGTPGLLDDCYVAVFDSR